MEEQKKNPAQGLSESEQVQVRRQKLADLQAAGHDPFTLTKYPQDAYSADLKARLFGSLVGSFAVLAVESRGVLKGLFHKSSQHLSGAALDEFVKALRADSRQLVGKSYGRLTLTMASIFSVVTSSLAICSTCG